MRSGKYKYLLISTISVITFLTIWQLATDVLAIMPNYSLPSPVKVAHSFVVKLTDPKPDGATLLQHIWASLTISLSGFAAASLVGIPLGVLMAWRKKADLFIRPLFDLFRSVPGLGWIPVMILFFGIGMTAKVAIVFTIAFVPVTINTYAGIKNTNPVHLWVAQTFGASDWQLLKKIALPSALPQIFTGLRQSLNMSWVSLVAAELLGASRGLGYMIQMNRDLARADLIIVGMLTIGGFGALMSVILQYFEDKYVKGGA